MFSILKKVKAKLFASVKQQMIALFLFTVLLTALTGMHLFNPFTEFIDQMGVMFSDTIFLNELSDNMKLVDQSLREYLTTRDSDSLNTYYEQIEKLQLKSDHMQETKRITGEQSSIIYASIANMLETYQIYTENAVQAKRGRTPQEYIENYKNATEVAGFIDSYIRILKEYHINENIKWYETLSLNISRLITSNYVLMVVVIMLNLVIIFHITNSITTPIEKLSKASEEISKGNFEIDDLKVSTRDEFLVLTNAFNNMKRNIRDYVEQLHDKQETETRLMEQKVQNLKMQALLHDAELKALQLQINPHFLFNTLNAAMQLSIMENAERTAFFIENLAKLLRYNAGSMDRSVILRDEISMITAYKELFEVRFGNIQNVEFEIEPDTLEALIPPMTIQPLVENAYIHGLGDASKNGTIRIIAKKVGASLEIYVCDDGKGMDEFTRMSILNKSNKSTDSEQNNWRMNLTGIGIENVVSRLKMFFDTKDCLHIDSVQGKGTQIKITVPFIRAKSIQFETDKRGRESKDA